MKSTIYTDTANSLAGAGLRSYDRMIIRDLMTEVRIGVHPWERHAEKPQRVIVNVELFAEPHTEKPDRLEAVVDYDQIRQTIRSWPQRPHTEFIEVLLDELVQQCFRDARVKACRVSILKPDIFNDAAAAGVELFRIRD